MDKNGYSIQYFEEKEIEHLAFTRSILSKEIELFEKIIDLQAKLFRGYAAVVAIHFYDLSSTDKIIFQSHV